MVSGFIEVVGCSIKYPTTILHLFPACGIDFQIPHHLVVVFKVGNTLFQLLCCYFDFFKRINNGYRV